MHHWLDSWPIHLLSVPRRQSVIRFPDSRVTLLLPFLFMRWQWTSDQSEDVMMGNADNVEVEEI